MHMTCWDDARRKQIYPSGKKEITYTYVQGIKNHNSTGRNDHGKWKRLPAYDGRGNILEICTKALDTGKVTDHMLPYNGMNLVIREEDAVKRTTILRMWRRW